mgnify:FL=1
MFETMKFILKRGKVGWWAAIEANKRVIIARASPTLIYCLGIFTLKNIKKALR